MKKKNNLLHSLYHTARDFVVLSLIVAAAVTLITQWVEQNILILTFGYTEIMVLIWLLILILWLALTVRTRSAVKIIAGLSSLTYTFVVGFSFFWNMSAGIIDAEWLDGYTYYLIVVNDWGFDEYPHDNKKRFLYRCKGDSLWIRDCKQLNSWKLLYSPFAGSTITQRNPHLTIDPQTGSIRLQIKKSEFIFTEDGGYDEITYPIWYVYTPKESS